MFRRLVCLLEFEEEKPREATRLFLARYSKTDLSNFVVSGHCTYHISVALSLATQQAAVHPLHGWMITAWSLESGLRISRKIGRYTPCIIDDCVDLFFCSFLLVFADSVLIQQSCLGCVCFG